MHLIRHGVVPLTIFATITLVSGCDEYHPPADAPASQSAPSSSPVGQQGRSSALGGARQAADRTGDRMEDYNRRIQEEMDQLNP